MNLIAMPFMKYIVAAVISVVGIFIFTHYRGLTNTIATLEESVEARDGYITEQQHTINLERAKVVILELQKESLLNAIEMSNKALDDIKVKNDMNVKELEKWKLKVAKDGYEYKKEIEKLHGAIDDNKLKLGDCVEGLKLNKSISELDYDKI